MGANDIIVEGVDLRDIEFAAGPCRGLLEADVVLTGALCEMVPARREQQGLLSKVCSILANLEVEVVILLVAVHNWPE